MTSHFFVDAVIRWGLVLGFAAGCLVPSVFAEPSEGVVLTEEATDEGLPAYKIETPLATWFLEKTGAGLSSMVDRDGKDWLSFHPESGSGAGGEYRGFPNAVHQQGGSYFHPRNDGTDLAETRIESASAEHVSIVAQSQDGQWACRYDFYRTHCTFTMLKIPAERRYWVLYEGTPGGKYDDDDWWMTSAVKQPQPLTRVHEGDIPAPEWIAFGDRQSSRVLFVAHHEDDDHPDRFYQMQKKMTVFGYGREGIDKFLQRVPQSFSIGFVESTEHASISQAIGDIVETGHDTRLAAYERFALTHAGDAERGKELFADAERTRCLVCHKVNDQGGDVGPDISKIGGKFDRPHLIESILEPSRQILEGYRASTVVTEFGQAFVGIVRDQAAERIHLVDVDAKVREIAREDIAELTTNQESLMPTGLANELSPEEFTDLVAYLETLRPGGKVSPGAGIVGPIELPEGFQLSTVATSLTGLTALETTSDGRIFVCEQTGALRVVEDNMLLDEPFVTLPVESYWERGLIGVTVHPEFPQTPYVYVCYVAKEPYPHHRISRFTAEGNRAVPGSEKILFKGDDQTTLGGHVPAGHQGGALHFGPDGKLYLGLGEQTAGQPSQRLDSLLGKILRINPDGSIPADNPFYEQTTGKYRAIWARGFRNPYTFAFDPKTGVMLVNDIGGEYEDINRGEPGANYGWPVVEHGPTDDPRFTGPVHHYPHASAVGGDFIPVDSNWPAEFHGRYIFADYILGWIKTLDPNDPAEAKTFATGLRRPSDLRLAADGSLYVLLRNAWVIDDKFEPHTGTILRIQYVGESQ